MIFISHSQEDGGVYGALCYALDAANLPRWDPGMMSPSSSLPDQLRDAIHRCNVCVFLATRRSIESKWCLAEVGAFWGAEKKVFLFMGEAGLTGADLPPQFADNLWTNDVSRLINELRRLAQLPAGLVAQRPANLFWLGHDLARAIRFAKFESEIGRVELEKDLRQALHHLSEIGVHAPDARGLIVSVLNRVRNSRPFTAAEQEACVSTIAMAKNELGNMIADRQPKFRAYPSISEQQKLDEEARACVTVPTQGPPLLKV